MAIIIYNQVYDNCLYINDFLIVGNDMGRGGGGGTGVSEYLIFDGVWYLIFDIFWGVRYLIFDFFRGVISDILFGGGGSNIWYLFDFLECFTTTFLRAHSWLNWVDEDDDEVGLKEKPEDTRYIKKITSK